MPADQRARRSWPLHDDPDGFGSRPKPVATGAMRWGVRGAGPLRKRRRDRSTRCRASSRDRFTDVTMVKPVAPTPHPTGNAVPGQDPTVPAEKVQDWRVASGWHVAGTSRMGSTRQVNEDQLLVVPPRGTRPWLMAVADGVGGEAAGEVASAAAMHALQATWISTYAEPLGTAPPDHAVRDALLTACTAADEAVAIIQRDPATRGAATTLTALAISHGIATFVHAGDSAIWTVDTNAGDGSGKVVQLTTPHTWVASEIATRKNLGAPLPTQSEIDKHPFRNAITRYLGMPQGCEFEVSDLAVPPGTSIILGTDGLSNVIPLPEIAATFASHETPLAIATALIGVVGARKGGDDATLIVLVPTPEALGDQDDPFGLRSPERLQNRRTRMGRRVANGVAIATLAVGLGAGGAGVWPAITRYLTNLRGPEGADPTDAARNYIAQWMTGDYETLWLRLAGSARKQVIRDEFVRRHRDFMAELGAIAITGAPVPTQKATVSGMNASVAAEITYSTTRFGDLRQRVNLPFAWEDQAWRLQWIPSVLMPDLTSGRRIQVQSDPPVRGSIVDRNGRPMASLPSPASAPTAATPTVASRTTPLATATTAETPTSQVRTRIYPAGETAGPLIGYTAQATTEELLTLAPKGFIPGDRIGRSGLERLAETHLSGARGSRLNVLEPNGQIATTLATTPPRHGGVVTTTIDLNLQTVAEDALGARSGSVVVVDLPSGAIRALATWPRYDPSAFETGEGVAALLTDTRLPLLNRPVQGLYPAGSIFKVVTMAAALEHGVATPGSEFTCTGTWTGLPGVSQRCWLATGHGTITLANGLTQSCNSVFYELGKRLQEIGASPLPDVARAVGLGGTSRLMSDDEPSGLVPDPAWKRASLSQPWTPGDTVNLAIGQGQLLVTPLQMALVYAMIATGKPVMPTILAATSLPGGNVEQALPSPTPGASRKAWGASILAPMRSALRDVVGAREGTASAIFAGSPLARIVSGKTGTAETQPGKPTHAWFAGYGPPDSVAIVTMVEYGGEGSRVATPIARKVLEAVLG